MTNTAASITYQVWIRDQPLRPLISSADDPRQNPMTHYVGTYNMVEEATAAAKETGVSPIVYVDASRDLNDVSYAACLVMTVKRDPNSGLRIFDRR